MEQGAIPEAEPRLLARAILGLYNSVFHWYRPRAGLALSEVADFYVPRCLAVAGCRSRAAQPAPRTRAGAARERRSADASGRDRLAVAPGLAPGDRHVMDLVRPVGDLQDARDRVELGEQMVL